ncbi:hypothetical protein Pcinc_016995 [Petrolisthes cinctipes]|uniref:Uncharacterized protein n=1 Tax=Petrolisthes cinctipes TaxID=88211 RepID=A0AAE1FRB4_PETCI|nr:hypothetical protein Pcinc_016995 [Petrolisthes cinctipes]
MEDAVPCETNNKEHRLCEEESTSIDVIDQFLIASDKNNEECGERVRTVRDDIRQAVKNFDNCKRWGTAANRQTSCPMQGNQFSPRRAHSTLPYYHARRLRNVAYQQRHTTQLCALARTTQAHARTFPVCTSYQRVHRTRDTSPQRARYATPTPLATAHTTHHHATLCPYPPRYATLTPLAPIHTTLHLYPPHYATPTPLVTTYVTRHLDTLLLSPPRYATSTPLATTHAAAQYTAPRLIITRRLLTCYSTQTLLVTPHTTRRHLPCYATRNPICHRPPFRPASPHVSSLLVTPPARL